MSAHTPGPWEINTAGGAKAGQPFKITEIYVYAPNTQDDTAICADVIDPITQEPSEANALLIAAAPDLLKALRTLLDIPSGQYSESGEYEPAAAAARAAITKATGGKA